MTGFPFRRMVVTGFGALLFCATAATPVLAQNAVIRGTVTSQDRKEPITGVNVLVPVLNLSVLTSDRGTYVLTVPAARIPATPVTVTARAIGFKAQSRTMTLRTGEQTADFVLPTDINRLEEVIVTGTLEGVERAKVPFAVGRLTTEDLPVPSSNPLTILAGKVPGLRIASTTGRPGTAPEILLRGPTSINGSGRGQEPLIIVDGVIASHVGSIQELGGL
ncbi:MAG TPA: carboxypeptidase-like regulatory domain-containing protein, partial [Gemmatimonadales bacterium]|nr:carboxypeptidase-like regulatory domain-containing protein [Gemmatimonadales bacterium]